ncbi:archaemetzincin-2 isoform X2 [Suncus etruscus]|uniref:archaemetzincin-2 isoform X2 n=1 Tax=Suncus etruscus TaxID=109475 RepID=UPI00210F68D6|nr:archaemetzincin-2 isoform X2 [Suncus etruscus]
MSQTLTFSSKHIFGFSASRQVTEITRFTLLALCLLWGTLKRMEIVHHSAQTLMTALISNNPELVSQYEKLDIREQQFLNEAFQQKQNLFLPITLHSQSDWLTSHPEDPQDFEQFFSDPYRNKPSPEKHQIYIQCIGSLGNSRSINEEYIKWLKTYCEAFFYGLTVTLLEPVPVSATKCSFRVNDSTHNLQIHAGVGIFSFARYCNDFYSPHYKGRVKKQKVSPSDYSIFNDYYLPEVTSVLLLRSCKTLSHEVGHIFGLRHCQWLACLMQGSNHLEEADRRPLNLCPICLRKLQCAIGFKIVERYKALVKWIEDDEAARPLCAVTTKSAGEDVTGLLKPVEAFKDWKEWIGRCLAFLQREETSRVTH